MHMPDKGTKMNRPTLKRATGRILKKLALHIVQSSAELLQGCFPSCINVIYRWY